MDLSKYIKRFTTFFFFAVIVVSLTATFWMNQSDNNLATTSMAGNTNNIDYLNRRITQLLLLYPNSSGTKKQTIYQNLSSLSGLRLSYLKKEALSSPDAFNTHLLPGNVLRSVPSGLTNLFENKAALTGTVKRQLVESVKPASAKEKYLLILNNDTFSRYELIFPKKTFPLVGIPNSELQGTVLDNIFVVNRQKNASAPRAPQIQTPSLTSGILKTLVIMFNFNDDSSTPFTQTQVVNQFFNNTDSVNRFFQEESYGKLSLTGKATPWLHINASRTSCSTQYINWTPLANQAARAADPVNYEPNNYDRVIYLFPYQSISSGQNECGFAAVADSPGKLVWLNGNIDSSVVAHEMTHNMQSIPPRGGWGHAYALNCGNKAMDKLSNCTTVDGQNFYDLMNSIAYTSVSLHTTSPFKNTFAWFDTGRISDVTTSGTYQMSNLEQSATGAQVLRIPRIDAATGAQEYYYLEFRQAIGPFDNQYIFQSNPGVVIELYSTDTRSYSGLYLNLPYVIDTTPGDGTFENATLKVGNTFTDNTNPNNTITVTRLGDVSGRAQLQITLAGQSPTATPTLTVPTVTPTTVPPTPTPTTIPVISCTSDSQCPAGFACMPTSGSGVTYPAGNTSPTPSPVILSGECRVKVGGACAVDNNCMPGLLCHTNPNGTKTCTNPTGPTCAGSSDTSCPTGYFCLQNCGSPVLYPSAPTPGYSCVVNEMQNRPRNCPVCLSQDSKISTPNGEIPVTDLRIGMTIWSLDSKHNKIRSQIIKLAKTPVSQTHMVYELNLADGRHLRVSPNHPLVNGMPIQSIKVGDIYDSSLVIGINLVKYNFEYTYDLLPDSSTGIYYANKIPMGSTLK